MVEQSPGAQAGLAAPNIRIFCTDRFDRPRSPEAKEARSKKLHQEDFCQILGVEPERKYEADGGPGLKKCAAALRRYSSLPADDLVRLIRWVGFNYLIGNEDAHAKNVALLYLAEGLRLTPHYDLVSTEVYPGLARLLAMKLGRAWDIRTVQRSDWQRVADAMGVPWNETRVMLLELVARVNAAARRGVRAPDATRGEPIEVEELRIDPREVQAYVDGESVELTPTEFRLLYQLALDRGRVVTRDELLQKLWGRRESRRDRTVDVFVRRLRDKIDRRAAKHTFIQTRYGVGYKLEAELKD